MGYILVIIVALWVAFKLKFARKYGTTPIAKDPSSPLYLVPMEDLNKQTIFPWEDVMQCNHVQRKSKESKPCPKCNEEEAGVGANSICWVYFKSPSATWQMLSGREGYLSICSKHKLQVDFIGTRMN